MAEQRPWYKANNIMLHNGFSVEKILAAQIWAARDHTCPKCNEPPYFPCVNLNDVKRNAKDPFNFDVRKNKYPHAERVDWDLLVEKLVERGYW